jgi:small-conductance mechanosensitive channel
MLFERSVRVGDFVELESGLHGEVRDINIRATLISTNDRSRRPRSRRRQRFRSRWRSRERAGPRSG